MDEVTTDSDSVQPSGPTFEHHHWFHRAASDIETDYRQHHETAQERHIQKAGHAAEATWVNFLAEWLPPTYEVVTRKYIIKPESDDRAPQLETDIVVLTPGYPKAFRRQAYILAGGVAAAFSVKLTLDASGLREAIHGARSTRAGMRPIGANEYHQMTPEFPYGVLAHTHSWKAGMSTPVDNVDHYMWKMMDDAEHPYDLLDFVCVADLGVWTTFRVPEVEGRVMGEGWEGLRALTGVMTTGPVQPVTPVADLVSWLWRRLGERDADLARLANSMLTTRTTGGGEIPYRYWDRSKIFE